MPTLDNAMNVVMKRQMDIFTKHLELALRNATDEIEGIPIINALAGAIVMLEAAMLAPIENKNLRKETVKRMQKMRPICLAAARQKVDHNVNIIDMSQQGTIQ